ncbi:hypothetical protein [Paraburkholderia sediminicola]|uniref:hypothetical protein n=1 Tax=Paraburkholderia sediminicola TaxID=458836 RepID=UPI0038B92584
MRILFFLFECKGGTLDIGSYVANLSKREENHPAIVRWNAHRHTLRATLRLRTIASEIGLPQMARKYHAEAQPELGWN